MIEFVYLCTCLILKCKMKKRIFLYIPILMLILSGCSSLDDDAKKAADYSRESIELVRTKDLDEAKEKYDKAQSIINEYKNTDKYQEFNTAYNAYLHNEAGEE